MIPLPAPPSSLGEPINPNKEIANNSKLETNTRLPGGVTKGNDTAPIGMATDLTKTPAEKVATRTQVSTDLSVAAKAACIRPEGFRVRLFTQVYGPEELKALSAARSESQGREPFDIISFEPIENVEATAQKFGTRQPYRWSVPTLIYHNESERECAEKLANIYEKAYGPKPNIRPLPDRLKKQTGAIELWVPIDGSPKLTKKMPIVVQ